MDFLTVPRACVGDRGLYLPIDHDEPAAPIVDPIEGAVGGPANQNP